MIDQLRVARREQHPRVAHQLDRLEARIEVVDQREREIELAREHGVEQHALVLVLEQADLDRRQIGPEPAHRLGQQLRAGGLEGADAQRARLARGEGEQVAARDGEARQHALGVPHEHLALRRQRHRPRAARSLDQGHANDALECRDLLGDGRLRVAELVRGPGERARPPDRHQCPEMTHLDRRITITVSDQHQSNAALE